MPTVTLENNEKIEMSNEQYAKIVDAIVEAARGHNGEQLIRDLEPGEYEICGKRIDVVIGSSGNKCFRPPYVCTIRDCSWIEGGSGIWMHHDDFERVVNKYLGDITADDIVRIEPKTGTALLDELEPGTLVAINGVKCCVMCDTCGRLVVDTVHSYGYRAIRNLFTDWEDTINLSQAINKPVADLVESDIVPLSPKEA